MKKGGAQGLVEHESPPSGMVAGPSHTYYNRVFSYLAPTGNDQSTPRLEDTNHLLCGTWSMTWHKRAESPSWFDISHQIPDSITTVINSDSIWIPLLNDSPPHKLSYQAYVLRTRKPIPDQSYYPVHSIVVTQSYSVLEVSNILRVGPLPDNSFSERPSPWSLHCGFLVHQLTPSPCSSSDNQSVGRTPGS